MSALLDPATVPDLPADPSTLIAAADAMVPAARTVRHRTGDAVATWTTLSGPFQTPDTTTVITALQPATAAAADFEEAAIAASVALRSLGEALADLSWNRDRLIDDIAARRSSVLAYQEKERACVDDGDPLWRGSGLGYTPDDELALRRDTLRGLIEAALEECERDLRRVGQMSQISPVMWARVSPQGPALTAQQRSAAFGSAVSMTILERLAGREVLDVTRLLGQHPEWLTMVRDHPPVASDVAAWWRSLDATHATNLIAGAPLIIGNLEGVSYAARDLANRASLTAWIAEARAAVEAERIRSERNWGEARGGGEWRGGRGAVLRDRLATLLNIEAALNSVDNRTARYLMSISQDHPPLAAVAIGDPDHAETVTYCVPGMGTTTRNMVGWSIGAQRLYDEQMRSTQGQTFSVVAWIGYETPPVPISQGAFEVLDNDHAKAGGEKLSQSLAGFAASREHARAINVVGHSYGTTTSAFALTSSATPRIAAFVNLGSAGLPAWIDSASDVNADFVYAGQARNVIPLLESGDGDQWAWTGRSSLEHPIDPSAPAFGAHVFGVDGDNGMQPVTDHSVLVTPGEGWGYLDPATESLRNIALVTVGQGSALTPAVPKGYTKLQQQGLTLLENPGYGL